MTATLISETAEWSWNGRLAKLDGDDNPNVLQVTLSGSHNQIKVGVLRTPDGPGSPCVIAYRLDPTAPSVSGIDWTRDVCLATTGFSASYSVSAPHSVISVRVLEAPDIDGWDGVLVYVAGGTRI